MLDALGFYTLSNLDLVLFVAGISILVRTVLKERKNIYETGDFPEIQAFDVVSILFSFCILAFWLDGSMSPLPTKYHPYDPGELREVAEGVYAVHKWSGFLKPSEVADREGVAAAKETFISGPHDLAGYSYYPGDLTIGSSRSVAEFSWSGEILVGGNLTVAGDMSYSSGSELKILVWGDVSVGPGVSETVGTWFVRGTFQVESDGSEKPKPRVHLGKIFADGPGIIER